MTNECSGCNVPNKPNFYCDPLIRVQEQLQQVQMVQVAQNTQLKALGEKVDETREDVHEVKDDVKQIRDYTVTERERIVKLEEERDRRTKELERKASARTFLLQVLMMLIAAGGLLMTVHQVLARATH